MKPYAHIGVTRFHLRIYRRTKSRVHFQLIIDDFPSVVALQTVSWVILRRQHVTCQTRKSTMPIVCFVQNHQIYVEIYLCQRLAATVVAPKPHFVITVHWRTVTNGTNDRRCLPLLDRRCTPRRGFPFFVFAGEIFAIICRRWCFRMLRTMPGDDVWRLRRLKGTHRRIDNAGYD